MRFTPEVYKAAALEHARAVFDLYRAGRFALCFYVSGLAVECLLRSLKPGNAEFDQRHDLKRLAKSTGFFDLFPTTDADARNRLTTAFDVVLFGWENRHRFRSAAALRIFLKEKQMDRRIKGDFVKENSRQIANAALDLVMYVLGEQV